MRVLLVEDNAGLARGLANALRDYGHAVDWLTSGEEAADFMRVHGADLAIIDVNLPDITGFSVVRALRARGDATPVLMLTARGATEDRVAGLDAGADDYLVKPFEMAELLARIRALDRRRPELRAAAERLGYSHRDIISGAGHDACWINRVAPTAMVMCPCVDGLSHNEAEEISPEWAARGTDVLFHAVVETAQIVS